MFLVQQKVELFLLSYKARLTAGASRYRLTIPLKSSAFQLGGSVRYIFVCVFVSALVALVTVKVRTRAEIHHQPTNRLSTKPPAAKLLFIGHH